MTEDEKRDAVLADLAEAYRRLGEQHCVLIGLVRALIVERAEDDAEATQRLVDIVEMAFELNQEQRQFLAQMTTVAPGVADESPSLTAH